jgi:hypothetical protein
MQLNKNNFKKKLLNSKEFITQINVNLDGFGFIVLLFFLKKILF